MNQMLERFSKPHRVEILKTVLQRLLMDDLHEPAGQGLALLEALDAKAAEPFAAQLGQASPEA